jgi:DNA helicase HerA-like ATPase
MKIGKIVSVEYDKFRVRLFSTTKHSTVSINGQVYYFGNIGSYLKTSNATGDKILCEVSAILDYSLECKTYSTYDLDSSREFIVKPVGTINLNGEFTMGVGIFPSLYNDVEIVTFDDLRQILSPKDGEEKNGIHHTIDLGYSKSLINYKISLNINKLFNIHTAVLGNSGSGKSNTIAHILQEVLRKESNHACGAKIILFDSNGEYPQAFNTCLSKNIHTKFYKPNLAKCTSENTEVKYQDFFLPYYLMNLDEWLAFLMASERTQKPFWDNVLQECYKFYSLFSTKREFGTSSKDFADYIKWKTWRILTEITNTVDSDSSRMTAAKAAIQKMKEISHSQPKDIITDVVMKDLENFFSSCIKLCSISYGNNNGSMADALPLFVAGLSKRRQYVHVTQAGNNYKTSLSGSPEDGFSQINEKTAERISELKLQSGSYFDYHFLKTAAEMVLLEEEAKGNLRIREFTSTLMTRLDVFLHNDECRFMRADEKKTFKDENDYLNEIFHIKKNDDSYQLITIDSSEVGTDVLELLTSVISRIIFDYRKKELGDNRRKHPVHLVLDEAHRYIRKDADYILRENIFEKIAREGRKYSLFLLISSQRPSELSQTVLSQCGNYIVHRIQNEVDMNYIYSVLPYFSSDYINKIKQAVPGEALVFGNCVPMPLMVKIDQANPDPNSKNCLVDEEWYGETNKDTKQ